MKKLFVILVGASTLLALPPRPGVVLGKAPVFPPGVEVPGPNRLKGFGQLETVCILMQFPDNRADTLRRGPARFDSMLYSTAVYTGQPYRQGSLNDFYLENSYGDFHVLGGIAGNRWFTSTYYYSRYYDGDYMLTTGGQLADEDVAQVDAAVDFRQFDLNHDGHIDALFLVHAGADGADNGNVNCCWSHAIPYFNYATDDGVTIDGVTNVPEFAMVTPTRETTMCCIAVMCHEMGHLVGLPDLYDYSRTSWGVGYWGLMGYGAWGAGGNTPWSPSHLEAWSKVEAGFVVPEVLTHDTFDLHVLDIETHPIAYKVWRNGRNTDTCFYLENRQQKGFDTPLPGAGLCIWHIDPAAGSMDNVVDMEEDSTFHLDSGPGVRPDPHVYHQELGDTSDVLPGIWNRRFFDNNSKPNSRARNGSSTGVAVRYIRQVGDTIICDVQFDVTGTPESGEPRSLAASSPGTRLVSATPNPFRNRTKLQFAPALQPGRGYSPRGVIYAANGSRVCEFTTPANGQFTWSGTDRSGCRLPPGVYLLRTGTDQENQTLRLVRLN
jgi:immune inhibitor A